jgi:hypothetical protein
MRAAAVRGPRPCAHDMFMPARRACLREIFARHTRGLGGHVHDEQRGCWPAGCSGAVFGLSSLIHTRREPFLRSPTVAQRHFGSGERPTPVVAATPPPASRASAPGGATTRPMEG